jgi:hypothetical protein
MRLPVRGQTLASVAEASLAPTSDMASTPCAAPYGATVRPAASTSVVAVKQSQPHKPRPGPTTSAERPNRMGRGRRVNQDGTPQKGAEDAARCANCFGALFKMELDVLDDLD